MKLVIAWVLDIVHLFIGKKKVRPPTMAEIISMKDDIAATVDRLLDQDSGRDDGRIIRIKKNGYHYYITRSREEERKKY